MTREKKERPMDELVAFVSNIYKFLNIDKASVIKNTVRTVRGDKVALRDFVQNSLTTAYVLDMEVSDIELGILLFPLLLGRNIMPAELGNMVEYLGTHTRADMIKHILASSDWRDRLDRLI